MEETTETKQSPIVRTVSRLLKLMGVAFPKDVPDPTPMQNDKVTDFTYRELRHVPGFNPSYDDRTLDSGGMVDYVKSISQKSRSWSKEVKNLKIMAPEINRAKDIVVSTILSPTDLQTENINITVADTGLGEQLESELSTELQTFFNKELKLSRKLSKWIGDALFEVGASAVLVLPQKNLETINKAIDLDYIKSGVDPNDHILKEPPSKPNKNIIGSSEQLLQSCEALYTVPAEQLEVMVEDVSNQYLETLVAECPSAALENMSTLKSSVKDTTSRIANMINGNKNCVMFSKDPTFLKATSSRLETKLSELTKDVEKQFLFNTYRPTFLVGVDRMPGKEEQPITMTIPYHSIVPVTVPNSPEMHIGYFIIVDEWGTPLHEDYYDATASGGGKKMSEAGTQAILGKPQASALSNLVTETSEFEAATTIFGIMLRHMMDNKLNEFGLAGASVNYRDAISASLFRQLLHKKRVGMVFVPEPLMLYLCYDYNDNGTGKSCIQDHEIIIALRNILVIAGVMAATENSIDKKRIEVAVDEKNANIEQTLNMVRNAFVEKNMLRFDNNPHTIQRDLVQKSMTIFPRGVRGLQDALNVSTERAQTNSIEPNDVLMTKLTDLLVMNLIAPAASLNRTADEEFSRSVATTNLFFNNQIRDLQTVTVEGATKFVRLYSNYSDLVYKKIYSMLEASELKRVTKRKVKVSPSVQDSTGDMDLDTNNTNDGKDEKEREHILIEPQVKKDIKTNTDTIDANVLKVINNISVTLPAPRIVVDKAHFEEIQGYIGTLDTILQSVYADEMSMDIDAYAKPLKVLRAAIKDEMIREYVKSIGFQSTYNLPPLSEVSPTSMEEALLHLINVAKGMDNIHKHIGQVVLPEQDSGGFGGGEFGGGGEDSFGGSGGSDMFGGGGFGGAPSLDDEPGGDQLATGPQETAAPEAPRPPDTPTGETSLPGGSLT